MAKRRPAKSRNGPRNRIDHAEGGGCHSDSDGRDRCRGKAIPGQALAQSSFSTTPQLTIVTVSPTHKTSAGDTKLSAPTTTTPAAPVETVPVRDVASGGLSSGAKVGIGVTVPLIAIIAGLFFFWFWRRRRLRNEAPELTSVHQEQREEQPVLKTYSKPEMEGSEGSPLSQPPYPKSEMDARMKSVKKPSNADTVAPDFPVLIASPTVHELNDRQQTQLPELPLTQAKRNNPELQSRDAPRPSQPSFDTEPWQWAQPYQATAASRREDHRQPTTNDAATEATSDDPASRERVQEDAQKQEKLSTVNELITKQESTRGENKREALERLKAKKAAIEAEIEAEIRRHAREEF